MAWATLIYCAIHCTSSSMQGGLSVLYIGKKAHDMGNTDLLCHTLHIQQHAGWVISSIYRKEGS